MSKIPNPNKFRRIKRPVLSTRELASAKIRITTYLDKDILERLQQMAAESGGKYQTILNQVLRDYLFGTKEGLIARLTRLEKTVFAH